MNRLLLAALAAAGLAPGIAAAARPPMYLVVDFAPGAAPVAPGQQPARRTVTVRAFDDGDPGACARAQAHFPNRPGSAQVSSCVRELPAEFAPLLQDSGLPKAYALKFTDSNAPGATYKLMYDMATTNAPQVCRNLVDYQQRFGGVPPTTRIRCWVPKG